MGSAQLRPIAVLLVVSCTGFAGQVISPAPSGTPAATTQIPAQGLENPWDVRKTIAALQKDTTQFGPLLAQLNPQTWVNQKGAPTTYIVQWQSAQQQLRDVMSVTSLFSQRPDNLSGGLDLYFRLEALEFTQRSLAEGAGRYDSRTNADSLNAMLARNFTNRERLREYLKELAATTEENFRIADSEAQRCRGVLSQQALPAARKARKN